MIVDIATTKLWPFLKMYQRNSVPILIDVSHVQFHDCDSISAPPSIHIFNIRNPTRSIFTAFTHSQLLDFVQAYLSQHFLGRLGLPDFDEPPVTHVPPPYPHIQELGGQLPEQLPTSLWVNPLTNEVTTLI